MTRHWAVALAAASLLGAAVSCGPDDTIVPGPSAEDGGGQIGEPDAGTPDAGTPDAGEDPDAGTPDGGEDAGVDAGPGPWPTDPVLNYSATYGIDSIQSVGVDDAHNIWLLRGDRIGVLRPGTTAPVWTSGIGQAAGGFGEDRPALGSTVICGGAANLAYVGYWHGDEHQGKLEAPDDVRFTKGDMDVVQLNADGTISLVEHLNRSAGTSQPWPPLNIGIRNSNDWHFNEDVSVLTCAKVMRGRDKGEIYIGTNHGVTRIRGLEYNSHRHPIWERPDGTPMMGYTHGVGISQSGEVLIANEWKVGIVEPPEALGDWEFFPPRGPAWALDTFNHTLNPVEEFDYWRGFQQTTDGEYYLGSSTYGLWRMERTQWAGSANWFKVSGLPTEAVNALAATDDGSLFIGTDAGLWRMDATRAITLVEDIPGGRIRELFYDPTVTPAALYVLADDQLYVIRGH